VLIGFVIAVKDAPLRALFLADKERQAKPDWTFNMLLRHGVRSCLEYAKSFDLEPDPRMKSYFAKYAKSSMSCVLGQDERRTERPGWTFNAFLKHASVRVSNTRRASTRTVPGRCPTRIWLRTSSSSISEDTDMQRSD
jgi:hypothetical protein